jgi:hypothetical protein
MSTLNSGDVFAKRPHLLGLALFALLMFLAPSIGLAEELTTEKGQNAWDLYVFGNGYVVSEVLRGVSLIVTGSGIFTNIMLVLAGLGFLSLAIAAGFDPARNLIRMFTYIVAVWFINYAATQLTVKVVVTDLVSGNSENAESVFVVDDVPAIIGLPAALTSEVGYRITQLIETNFSSVSGPEFTVSAGQFNLFATMAKETGEFQITDPELKKTLGAYVTNCVVPNIALGRFSGVVASSNENEGTRVYGARALIETTDMLGALGTAASAALLTPYYPPVGLYGSDANAKEELAKRISAVDPSYSDYNSVANASGTGILMSCQSAYGQFATDMEKYANGLLSAGAESWAKTGVMVPFENAFTAMLSTASAGKEVFMGGRSVWTQPSGYIMQTAFINSMSGAARTAAAQTGNNELMQAAAIAQAEQSQKSSWVAGFAIFNNLIGYVFTVLQAFIFAITPLIVMAVIIPGIGKTIFVNYAQILVWLTLWTPLLAVVNFIITLFASSSFAASIGYGPSMANKALVSERMNDLVIAAQFLGTMVPMLSWGIVKGAMAFTEFISAGIGSSFAQSAGASAATGNLSMNNLSMNNTGVDKFNTMMSSSVGFQSVQAGVNSAAMLVNQDTGGSSVTMNGKAADLQQQFSNSLAKTIEQARSVSDAISKMDTSTMTRQTLEDMAAGKSASRAEAMAAQQILAAMDRASRGKSNTEAETSSKNDSVNTTGSESDGVRSQVTVGGNVSFGGTLLGTGFGFKGGADRTGSTNAEVSKEGAQGESAGKTKTGSEQVNSGSDYSDTANLARTSTGTNTRDTSYKVSEQSSISIQEAASQVKSYNDTIAEKASSTLNAVQSISLSHSTSINELEQHIRSYQEAIAGIPSYAQMSDSLNSSAASVMASTGDIQSRAQGGQQQMAQIRAGMASTVNTDVSGTPAARRASRAPAEIRSVNMDVSTRNNQVTTEADNTRARATRQRESADNTKFLGPSAPRENPSNPPPIS